MQKVLQSIGFLLAVAGAAGLIHHFAHWFRLFVLLSRIPLVARYDIFANAAVFVLGLALLIAGDQFKPRARS
jgi:hypothetical protein